MYGMGVAPKCKMRKRCNSDGRNLRKVSYAIALFWGADVGRKRARLSSGRIDQRSAAPGLRPRRDPEFDDYSDGKPGKSSAFRTVVLRSSSARREERVSTGSNAVVAHDLSLGGGKGAFVLRCSCGWQSSPEEKGGPLLKRARQLHPIAYKKTGRGHG